MENRRILFMGTACNPAARMAAEGSCMRVVNLRMTNGSLRPTGTPTLRYTPAHGERTAIYVHSCHGACHLIACHEGQLFHEADIDTTAATYVNRPLLALDEEITAINALGNTLMVITRTHTFYLLHHTTGYAVLGEMPSMPLISLCEYSHQYHSAFVPAHSITGEVTHLDETVRREFTDRHLGTYYKLRDSEYDRYRFVQPVAMRYALRLYDGSHILPSPPVLLFTRNIDELHRDMQAYFNYSPTTLSTTVTDYTVGLYSSTPGYIIEHNDLAAWRDIVTAIDFFVSPQLPLFCDETIEGGDYSEVSDNRYCFTYRTPTTDAGELEELARDTTLFYKLFSIENPADAATGVLCEMTHSIRPDAVSYRSRLAIDTANFHRRGAACALVYNGRLHLADVTQTYYEGYPAALFQAHASTTGSPAEACIITRLSLSDGDDSEVVWRGTIAHFTGVLQPILSYPDTRATAMEIAVRTGGYEYRHTFALDAIDNENRASYIHAGLEPIDVASWEATPIDETSDERFPAASTCVVRRYTNMLRVSQPENPFFFPVELTYTISDGSITGMAPTTAALSQGQYGEFPLYVFTTRGVWAMQVGDGTVCYSRCTPINHEVIASHHCMTVAQNSIIYLTGDAVTMISGAKSTTLLSLHEYPEAAFEAQLSQIVPQLSAVATHSATLHDYMSGVAATGYLYEHDELLFCNPAYPYMLVLHLPSRHLYRRSGNYRTLVSNGNTLWAQDEAGNILDLTCETPATAQPVALATRPIAIAPDGYARLREVAWRMQGYCHSLCVALAAAHQPEEAFVPLHRATYTGAVAGHLPIRLAAPPYKYFRLILCGTVDSNFHIDCAHIAALPCEANRLR